jgi:hypothetical protein
MRGCFAFTGSAGRKFEDGELKQDAGVTTVSVQMLNFPSTSSQSTQQPPSHSKP